MLCDLHVHSFFSDGTFSPAEIVEASLEAGLSAIALTDHNTVDGLPDFISAARGKNINIIPGAEFSADYNGNELHILGLFISPEHFATVSALMANENRLKEESNIALIKNLNRLGYQLDYAEIKRSTPSKRINRAHVATALVQHGYVNSVSEAFDTVLSKSAGCYVEPKRISAKEIIDFINSIGAVSVLAHPLISISEEDLIEFLNTTQGLRGMECYYSTYDEDTTVRSLRIAEKFGLLKSGGSDFHGSRKPTISLGIGEGNLRVPYDFYLALEQCSKSN